MKVTDNTLTPQELKAIDLLENSDLNNFFEMFESNYSGKIDRVIELVEIIKEEKKLSIKNKQDIEDNKEDLMIRYIELELNKRKSENVQTKENIDTAQADSKEFLEIYNRYKNIDLSNIFKSLKRNPEPNIFQESKSGKTELQLSENPGNGFLQQKKNRVSLHVIKKLLKEEKENESGIKEDALQPRGNAG